MSSLPLGDTGGTGLILGRADLFEALVEDAGEPLVDGRRVVALDEVRAVPVPDEERFEQDVFRKLQTLGYNVLPTVRCPFEAFATRESLFLTGVPATGESVEEKAHVMSNISSVVEKDAVLFVEIHTTAESIGGTPLIKKSELRRIRDRDEIEDIIAERRK